MAPRAEGLRPGSAASAAAKQAVHDTLEEVKDSLARSGLAIPECVSDPKSNSSRLLSAIWDDFIPEQFSSEPAGERPADWQGSATAALAVACLLGAPVTFLQFLLCVPWKDLADYHKQREQGDTLPPFPEVTQEERRWLANQPLQSGSLSAVLGFIYRPEWKPWLPLLLRTSVMVNDIHGGEDKKVIPGRSRTEVVAAMLDGGTPLHFAAVQGGAPQVMFLLSQGAAAVQYTNAGELPVELVPVCCKPESQMGKARLKQIRPCCWCGSRGGGVDGSAKCSSKRARWALLRASFLDLGSARYTWFKLLWSLMMCVLGWWGVHATLHRPAVTKHATRMDLSRRAEARQRARERVQLMRQQAQLGREHLASAVRCWGGPTTLFDCGEPGGDLAMTGSANGCPGDISTRDSEHGIRGNGHMTGGVKDVIDRDDVGEDRLLPEKAAVGNGIAHHDGRGSQEDGALSAEMAQACFYKAVLVLQGLGLSPITCQPRDVIMSFVEPGSTLEFDRDETPEANERMYEDCNVYEEEQAEIYSLWAQSVLLSFRLCCQQERSERVKQASEFIDMASRHCKNILRTAEKPRKRIGESAVAPVASHYQRVLRVSAALLVDTVLQQSATRAGVQDAQQLLQLWERHKKSDYCREDDETDIECLEEWAKTAESDLQLAEALQGNSLSLTQRLDEVYPATYSRGTDGRVFLTRPVSREAVQQMETALALARYASRDVRDTTQAAAANAAAEVTARVALLDAMSAKSGSGVAAEAIAMLNFAIQGALPLPRLQDDVATARGVLERWERRAEAVTALDAETERARASLAGPLSDPAFAAEYVERMQRLEAAIQTAREANISVTKAKRTAKDMQAQLTMVWVATLLEKALKQPTGGKLQAVYQEAEEMAAAANSSSGGPCEGLQVLQPVLHRAKIQLEVERSLEAMRQAAAICTTLADLPRLDAAIAAVEAAQAEAADPETFRATLELRKTLVHASRHRDALVASMNNLARFGRPEDADKVDQCLKEAAGDAELLEEDIRRAQEAVRHWRMTTEAEVKLLWALKYGDNSSVLARAIQEASAAGVTGVGDAKRALRLMQALEAAMQQAQEGSISLEQLETRVEAGCQGNLPAPFLEAARALQRTLTINEVKSQLESAVSFSPDDSYTSRSLALQAAVERAEVVLANNAHCAAENGHADASRGSNEMEEDLLAIPLLIERAREVIAEDAKEQMRLEEERTEQQRLKLERQQAEKEARERERQERSVRERAERNRIDREKAERREAERALRHRQLQEQQVLAEKSRREQDVMERLARERSHAKEREERDFRSQQPQPSMTTQPLRTPSRIASPVLRLRPTQTYDHAASVPMAGPAADPIGSLTPAQSQPQSFSKPQHFLPQVVIPDTSDAYSPLVTPNGCSAHTLSNKSMARASADFPATSDNTVAFGASAAFPITDGNVLVPAASTSGQHTLNGVSPAVGSAAFARPNGDAAIIAPSLYRRGPSAISPIGAEQSYGNPANGGLAPGVSANGGLAPGRYVNGNGSLLLGTRSVGREEWDKNLSGTLDSSYRLPSSAGSSFSLPSSASTTPQRTRHADLGGLSWNPSVSVPVSRTKGTAQSPSMGNVQQSKPSGFQGSVDSPEVRSLWSASPSLAGADNAFGTPLSATFQPGSQAPIGSTERHLPPRPDSAGILQQSAALHWNQQEAASAMPQNVNHSDRLPTTLSVQRPCRYYREGCCSANPCKFAHVLPLGSSSAEHPQHASSSGNTEDSRRYRGPILLDSRASSGSAAGSEGSGLRQQERLPSPPITSAAGALAFGAPGLNAFSGGGVLGGGYSWTGSSGLSGQQKGI